MTLYPKDIEQYATSLKDSLKLEHDTIVYSSAFRSLGSKTQVFPFPTTCVRSRLTHSLECSKIAKQITKTFIESIYTTSETERLCLRSLPYAVENASLLHDIGNTPLGHLGEDCFQHWWRTVGFKGKDYRDFSYYEGNARGFKILLDIFGFDDTFNTVSFQGLSPLTMAAWLKYPYCDGTMRKTSVFSTEKESFHRVSRSCGLVKVKRDVYEPHWLNKILDASDEIAYILADLEDAHWLDIIDQSTLNDQLHVLADFVSPGCPDFLSIRKGLIQLCVRRLYEWYQQDSDLPSKLIYDDVWMDIKAWSVQFIYHERDTLLSSAKLFDNLFRLVDNYVKYVRCLTLDKIYSHPPHVLKVFMDILPLEIQNLCKSLEVTSTDDPYYDLIRGVFDYVGGLTDASVVSEFNIIKDHLTNLM